MVVGGSDTSSNSIEFAMAHILNNQEVMKRVQEELDGVVRRDNVVEESHINKLPYLLAVMKETLRLHPALPLLVPHSPSETTTVGGYTIPKGSRVFVNVWAIHRDPSVWDNPLEFDPSRFLDANKWDYSGNDFNYFPFGSGRRMCAGIAMAERTFLYFLATLMHSFDWKLPEDQKLDISEKFGIVLKKKTPLVAIPSPRLLEPALNEYNTSGESIFFFGFNKGRINHVDTSILFQNGMQVNCPPKRKTNRTCQNYAISQLLSCAQIFYVIFRSSI